MRSEKFCKKDPRKRSFFLSDITPGVTVLEVLLHCVTYVTRERNPPPSHACARRCRRPRRHPRTRSPNE